MQSRLSCTPLGEKLREHCPRHLRQTAALVADYTCQGTLLGDKYQQICVPKWPSDVCPDVNRLLPIPKLYIPRGRGITMHTRERKYPVVVYRWACLRRIPDCFQIDRFRPQHAAGHYAWHNVGVLCPDCNALKRQFWPWLDYRTNLYKRKMETYFQKQYGPEPWLEEEKNKSL